MTDPEKRLSEALALRQITSEFVPIDSEDVAVVLETLAETRVTITPEKELRGLLEKATPGIWRCDETTDWLIQSIDGTERHQIEVDGLGFDIAEDRDACVAAINALPDLLDANASQRAELSSERQEREKAERDVADLTKALTGLTCGGSEFFRRKGERFVADIPACVEYVQRVRRDGHEGTLRAIRDLQAAQSKLSTLKGENERLKEEVASLADLTDPAIKAQRDELVEACKPFAAIEPSSLYPADGSNAEDYMVLLRSGFSNPIAFTGADLARLRALSTIDTTGAKT